MSRKIFMAVRVELKIISVVGAGDGVRVASAGCRRNSFGPLSDAEKLLLSSCITLQNSYVPSDFGRAENRFRREPEEESPNTTEHDAA